MWVQTILVVEDDTLIRKMVSNHLDNAGYEVVEASNGEEAKDVFLTYHPCLIVLDLVLPKVSGEQFFQWVKKQKRNEVSIIILSGKGSTEDKIKGLKMGADGYVTKPFDMEELLANIEAVLRRTGQFCQKISYNGLCIMPRKGEAVLFEEKLDLTKHEFLLLYHFMENPNRVLSREELIQQLYPFADKTILERTIDAHIKKLREKVESTSKPQRIQTVRGMGYKFVP